MKTIREIRRDNLIRLLGSYKSKRQFAESVGLAPAHVSQLVSGVRDMGEEVARRIEQALGLSTGFMSLAPDVPAQAPTIEPELHYLPSDELKLLANYRRMSPRHKELVRETTEVYVMMEKRSGGTSDAG